MEFTKLQYHLVIILQICVWYCKASNILIYEEDSRIGNNAKVNISTCSNLNESVIPDVKSADLNNNCARLYDQKNCSGNFIEIYPRVPDIDMLSKWKQVYLEHNVKSVGPCPNPCYQQIYNQSTSVEIFSGQNHKGPNQKMKLEKCFDENTEKFIKKFKSIKTNVCVRLYSSMKCNIMGPNVKFIDLRPGTPYHENLEMWNLFEIKSISLCSLNCPNISNLNAPTKDQVFLFTEVSFEGSMTKRNLTIETCVNVYEEGNGFTNSVKIGEGTCATLFSEENCIGNEYKVEVSVYNFNVVTKSIALCDYTRPQPSTDVPNTNNSLIGKPALIDLPVSRIAIICSASLAGLILMTLAIMCLKNKLFIKVREKLAEKDVKDFFDGYDINVTPAENNEQHSTEAVAQSKPYNKQFDVLRSRVDYDMGKLLRKTDMDVVYKGTMPDNLGVKKRISMIATIKKVHVAVKVPNPAAGINGLQSLLKEVKVMLHLGKHDNIAYMIGCCTENLRQGKLFVLMEFCSDGTLELYLHANRQTFVMCSEKNDVSSKKISVNLKSRDSRTTIHSQPQFDTLLLLQWCVDVSRGMEFLSNANIVHSDLAARNILLTSTLQAKISDFGLSRQMHSYSKNVHTQQEPLPWRWMAAESIQRLEFTTKTDVWSYGVLYWEIFTLGEMPYAGVRSKDVYISNLEDGLRLDKPPNDTEDLHRSMMKCWEYDPNRRPTFMEITKTFEQQLLVYT